MPFVPDEESQSVLGPQKITSRFLPDDQRQAMQEGYDGSEPRRSLDWRAVGGAAATGGAIGAGIGLATGGPAGAGAEGTIGALAGGGSELAGQMAEKEGASPRKAELIRMGVGAAPIGLVGHIAAKALDKATFGVVSSGWNFLRSQSGKEVEMTMAKQTELMQQSMRKGDLSHIPQAEALKLINQGIDKEAANVQTQAKKIVDDATAEAKKIQATRPQVARQILEDARDKAGRMLKEAKDNSAMLKESASKLKIQSEQITKENAGELEKVGTRSADGKPVLAENIGHELQDPILKNQENLLQKRAAEYTKTVDKRNEIIAGKYEKGEKISQTEKFKSLLKELHSKLGDTGAGELSVTEKSEFNDIKNIIDALEGREVETGKMVPGNYDQLHPEKTKLPPDFEAIDTLRRKMGDVAYGKEVEGFKAISSARAKDLYAKLNDIQGEFVGDIQKDLQGDYSKLSKEINSKYKSGTGKKVTALDEYSDETLMDAHNVPKTFFSTPKGVRDAVHLSGDSKTVVNAASKYISMNLEGKTADAARAFLKTPEKSDWLQEVYKIDKENGGNLKERTEDYLSQLEKREAKTNALQDQYQKMHSLGMKNEQIDPNTLLPGRTPRTVAETAAASDVKKAAGKIEGEFQSRQEAGQKLIKDAEGTANEMLAGQKKEVGEILKGENPHIQIANLLASGNAAKMRRVSQWLGDFKQGKDVMADAVRQVLSTKGAKPLAESWNQQTKSALEESGLLTRKQIKGLDDDIAEIQKLHRGEAQGKTRSIINKLISQAISGYGGSLAGRAESKLMGND